MPLRAYLDGRSINAALLSDTEWQALKGSPDLRMPCCDAHAYRRTSRLGTRHFAHSPKHHCGAEGEGAEHLAAKAEIIRACNELGWAADSEVVGESWRADVLATRDERRLAFEVQWSPQTLEITRERQAAYGNDVKCCWLFKLMPLPNGQRPDPFGLRSLVAERNLPVFQLQLADSGFQVRVDHATITLREFVKARLSGGIRFRDQRVYADCQLQLVALEAECWRCHRRYDVFYTRTLSRSACGAELLAIDPDESRYKPHDPYGALRNKRLAEAHFSSELRHLRFSVARRYSRTLGRSYWSFGCPDCDALCGDWFFQDLINEAEDNAAVPLCSKDLHRLERHAEPHWCFPRSGSFCD